MPSRSSHIDQEIIELWKELTPSGAYLAGYNDCAGRLFVASEANIGRMLKRVRSLRAKSDNFVQKRVLDSFEAVLRYEEPRPVLDDVTDTLFAHMVKEGLNVRHMLFLFGLAEKSLQASMKFLGRKQLSIAVKMLAQYGCLAVNELFDTIKSQTKDEGLKRAVERAKRVLNEYRDAFRVEGFEQGTLKEAEAIFKKYGAELGREAFYPVALQMAFDYHETAEELEAKGLRWLEEELPKFRKVMERLAEIYGCNATVEDVSKAMAKRYPLKVSGLLKTTMRVRRIIQAFVSENVVAINPKYKTRVVETPPYLTPVLPTGAAQFFDTFTKPFQYYFITTDEKRDPVRTIADLIDLLVHEEYGHCVHHSNSALAYGARPQPIELIRTTHVGPVTEGLAFQRELEFLEAVKELEEKKKLSSGEMAYVRLMKKFGGLKLTNLEVEFEVRKGRITRFLRVIGDSRINSGKQNLLDFIDWAHQKTGLTRDHVYYQLFPAHEGIFPGYATCYAIVGQDIRSIQKRLKDRKSLVKFNTYACSIGFPPRSVYIARLKEFAKKLAS